MAHLIAAFVAGAGLGAFLMLLAIYFAKHRTERALRKIFGEVE